MSSTQSQAKPQKSDMTAGVSLRTLILMLELLVAVVAWQYVKMAEPIQARAIWLAADCHTASTVREETAEPAAAPAPATTDEGEREP